MIAMDSCDFDMRLAYTLGLTMEEYYAYYLERIIEASDRYAYATDVYRDLCRKNLESARKDPEAKISGVDNVLEYLVRQGVRETYLPKPAPDTWEGDPGIGFMVAVGMGIDHGFNTHILSIAEAIDFYFLMQEEEEIKQTMRGTYTTPQEYRSACESALAGMQDPEEKEMWTRKMDNVLSIYDLGFDPGSVDMSNYYYRTQQHLDSLNQYVYENGTPVEYGTFQTASGVTDVGLKVLEEFVISKGLGGKMLGSLVANFFGNWVDSTQKGRSLYEEGMRLDDSRLAAVGSAVYNTILDEFLEFDFMPDLPAGEQGIITNALIAKGYSDILSSKAGPVIEYIDRIMPKAYEVAAEAIEDGAKGAALNAID